MTRDELIKSIAWLREEAGLESAYPIDHPMAKFLMAFSEIAKAAEREACAKVCDPMKGIKYSPNVLSALQDRAKTIRARGQS